MSSLLHSFEEEPALDQNEWSTAQYSFLLGIFRACSAASQHCSSAPTAEGWSGCIRLWRKEGLARLTSDSSRRGPGWIEVVFNWKD